MQGNPLESQASLQLCPGQGMVTLPGTPWDSSEEQVKKPTVHAHSNLPNHRLINQDRRISQPGPAHPASPRFTFCDF